MKQIGVSKTEIGYHQSMIGEFCEKDLSLSLSTITYLNSQTKAKWEVFHYSVMTRFLSCLMKRFNGSGRSLRVDL